MPLSQAQIATMQRSASLGQAQLYAKAWGVSNQQLADILRNSTIGTLLPNIAEQHKEAGTPVPKQATLLEELLVSHPQETKYDIMGAIESTKPDVPETGGAKASIDIPITKTELQKITDAEAKGLCEGAMKAYYTVKTYTVTLKGGDKISVQALSNKAAKQKALKAGYKVAWVTWSPKTRIRETAGKNPVKDYLVSKGATWKDEYKMEDGYNIVLLYHDSVATGAEFRPNDLERLFGVEAVNDARTLLPCRKRTG